MVLPKYNRNFLVEIYVPTLIDNHDLKVADMWEAAAAIDDHIENYLRETLTEILSKSGVKFKEK
jgi:hypothetical protein